MTKKKNPLVFLDVSIDGDPKETMVFELFYDVAPKTAENFRALCTGEKGVGRKTGRPLHYKASFFHRIIRGSMAQAGDFVKRDGTVGESIYSGKFPDEPPRLKHDGPGLLSMAIADRDTLGSHFLITFKAINHLDRKHIVFGKLVQGFDVLKKIESVDVEDGVPTVTVKIVNCGEFNEEKRKINKMKIGKITSSDDDSHEEKRRGKQKRTRERRRRKRRYHTSDSDSSSDSELDSDSESDSDTDLSSSSSSESSSSDDRSRKRKKTSTRGRYRRGKRKDKRRDRKRWRHDKKSKRKSKRALDSLTDTESDSKSRSTSVQDGLDVQGKDINRKGLSVKPGEDVPQASDACHRRRGEVDMVENDGERSHKENGERRSNGIAEVNSKSDRCCERQPDIVDDHPGKSRSRSYSPRRTMSKSISRSKSRSVSPKRSMSRSRSISGSPPRAPLRSRTISRSPLRNGSRSPGMGREGRSISRSPLRSGPRRGVSRSPLRSNLQRSPSRSPPRRASRKSISRSPARVSKSVSRSPLRSSRQSLSRSSGRGPSRRSISRSPQAPVRNRRSYSRSLTPQASSLTMLRTTFLRSSQALRTTRALSTVSSKDQVGIIGLGQMGGRMADNLRKNGHNLVVCDPVPANVQKQVDQGGAVAASTPKEVAEQCDTIITMLPSTAIVENVYLGDNGVHEALRNEHLLLDSSTIDPIFTKKLSKELHDRGATFVDAPVSGGVAGAQNGTLTFMVGGEVEEFERVKPLLKAMGKNLVHCGGSSTGQIAKLCNNLALAIQMASVAEAMNLGTTLGIDPKILKNIMDTSTSSCWSTLVNHPYPGLMENVPASNNYDGGFAVALHRKDLGLAIDCAKNAEVSIPLTCQMHQLYNMMVSSGYGKKDLSYILPYLKNGK